MVLKKCPVSECVIIGLGRSPAPFISELRHGNNRAYNLPLSQFHFNRFEQILDSAAIETLYKHFDNSLGDLSSFKGKTILLLDYAQSGESLFSAQQHLDDFFIDRKIKTIIESIAITTTHHEVSWRDVSLVDEFADELDERPSNLHETAKNFHINEYSVIEVKKGGQLAKMLEAQTFDDFSEFGEAPRESWGKPMIVNPRYTQLTDSMSTARERVKGKCFALYSFFLGKNQ